MGGNAWLRDRGLWLPVVIVVFVGMVLWGVHDDHPDWFQGPVGQVIFGPPHRAKPARPARPGPPAGQPGASSRADRDIPARYLALYRQAVREQCPQLDWAVLAAVGKVESDHGRSRAPGVRSGLNRAGCCAGPMQFNLTDGPPSTWAQYGRGDVYDPRDAIPAAARKLCAQGAPGDLHGALLAYNRDEAYVAQVQRYASRYRQERGF